MALIKRSTPSPKGASFVKVNTGSKAPRTGKDGGVKVGVTHCPSRRSASNLKTSYTGGNSY
jgi:hypothetical protein